jgi:hypothetical protein
MNIEQLYFEVKKKAMVDESFRQELLENPKAAIEAYTGEKIDDNFTIKVIEQDPNYSATFVLPDLLTYEISTEDLDSVVGGVSALIGSSACAVAISIGPCAADACGAAACAENK